MTAAGEDRRVSVILAAGRPRVTVAAGPEALELAALLTWLNDRRVLDGRMPLELAAELSSALRYAARLADLLPLSTVRANEQNVEPAAVGAGALTVKEAAVVLGIGERGVQQRIARHKLRARRIGRLLLIDLDDVSRNLNGEKEEAS